MAGQSRVARFSIYSFDFVTLELRRKSQKIPLQEQSARVLAILLTPPGRLVTREQLREQLWPDVASFDYEHAINKAISQIRKTLGDDPRSKRFIETVPRQGYRFCAGVLAEPLPAPAPPSQGLEPVAPATPTALSLDVFHPEESAESGDPSLAGYTVPNQLQYSPAAETFPTPAHRPKLATRVRFASLAACLCLLSILGLLWVRHHWYHDGVAVAGNPIRIGIVPFETDNDAAKSIAENLRFDLSDSLGQVPGLQVGAAHSFTSAPRDNASMRAFAATAGLDVVLLGRLEVSGQDCVLHFEVVRATDNSHIASLSFAGNVGQLHSLRDRVQYAVYTTLGGRPGNLLHIPKRSATPEAYEAYLDGRHYLQVRTDESLNHAMARFQRAAELDPKFAGAFAGMANIYLIFADRGEDLAGFDMAKRLANKAISLDPGSAQAHAILGCILQSQDWNSVSAERELRLAVDLDSEEAVYHIWLATLLSIEGKAGESLQQITFAEQDDPFWPPVYQAAAFVATNAGMSALMLASAKKMVELTPQWPIAADQNAWAFWYAKRYPEAIAEWQRMAQLADDPDRVRSEEQGRRAFEKSGTAAYARIRLEALNSRSGHSYHDKTMEQAEWHMYAEEPNSAMDVLASMVARHNPAAITMAVDPAFAPLHSNPQFASLLQRIGLSSVEAKNQPSSEQGVKGLMASLKH